LSISTFITLLVMPVLYSLIERRRTKAVEHPDPLGAE
jgi:hypothetical protein